MASENKEEGIIAGFKRGERDKNNPAEIKPTLESDAVLHLERDPAERRALCKNGDERYAHPAGNGESGKGRTGGESDLAEVCGRAGIQRQEKRRGERGGGKQERAHSRSCSTR